MIMTSPKMKLPSIAELTSTTRPRTSHTDLPLSIFNNIPSSRSSISSGAGRSSISGRSSIHSSPETHPLPVKEFMAPSIAHHYERIPYDHYSYGSSISNQPPQPLSYSRPLAWTNPEGPMETGQGRFFTPGYEQNPVSGYNAPEVISKPMNLCHRCGTTDTPEWRRGPKGLRTLCNACGLFHAKLVKRLGPALAAEEVLNNKVIKGKNGRRVYTKRRSKAEIAEKTTQPKVISFPVVPQAPPSGGQLLGGSLSGGPLSPQSVAKDTLYYVPRQEHTNQPHPHYQFSNVYREWPHTAFSPGVPQFAGPGAMMSPPKLSYPEYMPALGN
ncbi:hypothetical protein JCM33374_g5635 [Metschnikowia sp. JCM 33374]|nr:hypothetical protein JCM33374_g5635 [Metschnikowia sp. JCM 33374]